MERHPEVAAITKTITSHIKAVLEAAGVYMRARTTSVSFNLILKINRQMKIVPPFSCVA